MNRTAPLLVALIVVVASAAVAPVAAQTDTSTSTATSTARTVTESGNDSVAAGALLSGAVGVQEAEIDGEVESRTFGIKMAKANTDDAKAKAVAEQLTASEERLTELQERLDSLEKARENGSISEDRYAARVATLRTEVNTVRRMGNATANASEGIPRETLEANGVDATAIETLRRNAANTTGPEVAAVAKTIASPGAGQAPDRAGSVDDRPDGNETDPDDRVDSNETHPTGNESDGYSSGGSDGPADASRTEEQGR